MTAMSLSIKICGMADAGNIREAMALCPDYLGLIFHPASPRNACNLNPEELAGVREAIKFVGVFVNRPEDEILARCEAYRLQAVQLHGDESPEFCHSLRGRGFEIWKAVGIETVGDINSLERYAACVDRFVFDRKSPRHGGTGKKFDWSLLASYSLPVGFMLGGGIGPEDADAIAALRHPQLVGIDLNSRFELSPGIKDIGLLNAFLKSLG